MLYRLEQAAYIRPIWEKTDSGPYGLDRLVQGGEYVGKGRYVDDDGIHHSPVMAYDGPPGPHLIAMDDEARARDESYYTKFPWKRDARLDVVAMLPIKDEAPQTEMEKLGATIAASNAELVKSLVKALGAR